MQRSAPGRALAVSLLSAALVLGGCVAGPGRRSTAGRGPEAGRADGVRGAEPAGARGEHGGEHHQGGVTLRQDVHHDLSGPLRGLPRIAPAKGPPGAGEGMTRTDILPHPPAGRPDSAVQTNAVHSAAPRTSASFDGLGTGFTGPAGSFSVAAAPPDTDSAVGPNHVVEIVNSSIAILSKSGVPVYGPAATNTLWTGFGGHCETDDDGDGIVRYDRLADRWVFTQFANAAATTGPYYECVAVSRTSDPTGAYFRYAFQYASFPDYPKLGVWPDAYYVTYNVFNGATFQGAEACALDRTNMLTGAAATQQCFTTSAAYGGVLPADLDGATPPPIGEPNLLLGVGASSTTLAAWKFHVDWATPSRSTFAGPTSVSVASYNPACGGGSCIPQPATGTRLDSLGDRLMFRLAYRNFGDHESLVVSHSVSAGANVGVRWYELRLVGGNPTIHQQSTFAPDSTNRWLGSAAMDQAGNIAVGYSVSSASINPGAAFSGRLAGDPLNLLTQPESTIVAGGGSQTGGLTRWGDYSSMTLDPSDDCTFWYSNEYLPASGRFNWRTRLGSFRLPGCGAPVAAAGPDQTAAPGTTVQLDGSSSTSGDSTVPAYTWDQTAGAPVVLDDRRSARPRFTAPNGAATLTFRLTVTSSSGQTATDDVIVTVKAPK